MKDYQQNPISVTPMFQSALTHSKDPPSGYVKVETCEEPKCTEKTYSSVENRKQIDYLVNKTEQFEVNTLF